MAYPDQADTNCKHSRMNFRACIKLPLDVDGIYAIINTQILKTPHDILVHLADLDDGKKARDWHTQEGEVRHILRMLHRELQGKIPAICKLSPI